MLHAAGAGFWLQTTLFVHVPSFAKMPQPTQVKFAEHIMDAIATQRAYQPAYRCLTALSVTHARCDLCTHHLCSVIHARR